MMMRDKREKIRREINRLYSEMDRVLNAAAGKGSLNERRARNHAASLKTEIDYLSEKIA